MEKQETESSNDSISIEIKFHKEQKFLTIPFLFINYDNSKKAEYKITWIIVNHKNNFLIKKIDIDFSIQDTLGNTLIKDYIENFNSNEKNNYIEIENNILYSLKSFIKLYSTIVLYDNNDSIVRIETIYIYRHKNKKKIGSFF